MKKYFRRHAYRWHRITSLVIALPVFLWTLSGFLHPVMNSFKPEVKNHSLPLTPLDSSKIRMTVKEVLDIHKIDSIRQSRIVEMYGSFYYQVDQPGNDRLLYISCFNGQMLLNGDIQYAGYLGQRYVSESNSNSGKGEHHSATTSLKSIVKNHGMNPDKINITDVEQVNSFTSEYKSSNVLLPVYRVDFDRKDHLRLYIDPVSGKLATAMNDQRAWFTRCFAITHSWSFMNGLGIFKHLLIGLISVLCLLSSALGYYVHNLTKPGKNNGSSRKFHRVLGNAFVVTTMLYAFSGGWHSLHKLQQKEIVDREIQPAISTGQLKMDHRKFFSLNDTTIKPLNFSAFLMNDEVLWQLSLSKEGRKQNLYFRPDGSSLVQDGEKKHAVYLANRFSGKPVDEVEAVKPITKFNNRYSMMKKRLPVMEVRFKDGTSWFIDISTGVTAGVAGPGDEAERFSFSNLHMHHYWDELLGKKKGKVFKNLVLISSTLGLMLLALTGIMMYRTKMKKRKAMVTNQA